MLPPAAKAAPKAAPGGAPDPAAAAGQRAAAATPGAARAGSGGATPRSSERPAVPPARRAEPKAELPEIQTTGEKGSFKYLPGKPPACLPCSQGSWRDDLHDRRPRRSTRCCSSRISEASLSSTKAFATLRSSGMAHQGNACSCYLTLTWSAAKPSDQCRFV